MFELPYFAKAAERKINAQIAMDRVLFTLRETMDRAALCSIKELTISNLPLWSLDLPEEDGIISYRKMEKLSMTNIAYLTIEKLPPSLDCCESVEFSRISRLTLLGLSRPSLKGNDYEKKDDSSVHFPNVTSLSLSRDAYSSVGCPNSFRLGKKYKGDLITWAELLNRRKDFCGSDLTQQIGTCMVSCLEYEKETYPSLIEDNDPSRSVWDCTLENEVIVWQASKP